MMSIVYMVYPFDENARPGLYSIINAFDNKSVESRHHQTEICVLDTDFNTEDLPKEPTKSTFPLLDNYLQKNNIK